MKQSPVIQGMLVAIVILSITLPASVILFHASVDTLGTFAVLGMVAILVGGFLAEYWREQRR